VFGGVLATAITLPVEVSMTVLTAIYVPALVIFVRGVREAHRFEGPPEDHLGGAHVRLAMAHQAWEGGSLRVAIVEASAAVDLAQSVVGPAIRPDERGELDELRRSAIDVDHVVRDDEVARALQLADAMIRAVSPT
jgi:hypothetical protein